MAGCATLPETELLSRDQAEQASQSFKRMISRQKLCGCCVDANAVVRYDSTFMSGTIDGIVQAMAPSYLKFVGLNPIGQPVLILNTNGSSFQFIIAVEKKGYQGPVQSEQFRKYAPPGIDGGFGYYWLIGKLQPGAIGIDDIRQDARGRGLWVELHYESKELAHHVLFDPERQMIMEHILREPGGDIVLDVRYDGYIDSSCALPGRVTISSGNHKGVLEIVLSDWDRVQTFTEQEFYFELPPDFEQVNVQ